MSTDTSVTELVINKLTKTQFEGIQNPSDTELYVVTDASYSYNDLSDTPTIPSNTSDLNNDSGFITSSALSGYAVDNDVVHLAGTETITGLKTFESDVKLSKTKPEVDLINTDLTKGTAPSDIQQSKISMLDKDDKLLAETAYIYNRDGETGVELRAYTPLANSTSFSRIGIYHTANSIYTICPTPTEDTTSSKQIDNVGARNTKLANYVTLSDAETITGAKTFTEGHLYMLGANNGNDISLKFNNVTQGTLPTSGEYNSFLHFYDKNNKALAAHKFAYTTSDAYYRMYCGRPTSGSTSTAYIEVRYAPSGACYVQASCQLQPTGDNNINLGSSSKRWKQLYAGTTTIATSDERFKQQIDSVPDMVLDAWGEVGFYQYKFNDAVEEKGENARYHTGMIAQRIKNAFENHNLNAFKYGLLCYDEWEAIEAQYDNDGEETSPAQEAGNRYSLRYEECLCMEAAYQRRRADRIEARLAALEARL